MYSHQLSIPGLFTRRQRETAAPTPAEGNFFRGFFFAIAFSLPLWALIIWGVYEWLR